jgi:hypothetical protein
LKKVQKKFKKFKKFFQRALSQKNTLLEQGFSKKGLYEKNCSIELLFNIYFLEW